MRRSINHFLQDKEMTRDCDQSERVFLQNIPHLLVNTESLLFVLLFKILTRFKLYSLYTMFKQIYNNKFM